MPDARPSRKWPLRLAEIIPLRIALYYAALGTLVVAVAPSLAARTAPLGRVGAEPILTPFGPVAGPVAGPVSGVPLAHPGLAVGVAVGAAFLLALPVAWVYMLTRERKGYRQTVVHTLVLLPMVVAGVAVLVKDSIGLALSVAGIAAAVRFRSTLDDSKDAVYLLVSLAIGVGAGADPVVALALSATFNVAALGIFYTDFGRTPPALEGERARRQLERAMAIANRTSQFVAQVDDAVLRELAPAQLDALAQRVRRRREDAAPELPASAETEFDACVRLVTTDATALRALVEPVLDSRVKRWRADPSAVHAADADDGDPEVVAYRVRWRKGTTPDAVLAALRESAAPFIVSADVL